MSHDDVPLPTTKVRRRSIFDDHSDAEDEVVGFNFPVDKTEIYYPIEYVEKVRTEIELWKMHITKILEEKHRFKTEKMELQSTTLDETILSLQQHDIITSFNFDEYVRRVNKFCDRAVIIAHKMQYKAENETEKRYLTTQSNLEKLIITKHFTDNIA